ncbi:MAG: hypothetical protein SVV03_01990 [Candidatus Nanohaloarchaea archaeon]|nr:hypothetical protein [Candidatus Nanohaloarchaea archaeon]
MNRSTSAPSRYRSGQSSLEFLVMIILALLIFTGFYTFFLNRQARAVENDRQTIAKSLADKISFDLDLALTQGDGFSREFNLREDIDGAAYNVTLGNGTVVLEYRDKFITSDTAVKDVKGDVKPGKNKVENQGGVIVVSQP